MKLDLVEQEIIDGRTKGMPPTMPPTALRDIGKQGWNLLKEDLPLPLAVIKQSALDQNSRFMREFLARSGAVIAPHGKTTMSPQLFAKQFEDGAWAITVATVQQMKVARDFGCERIVLANQLVGKQAIRYVLGALKADPKLDFYCLVDSLENVAMLRAAAAEIAPGRPLNVLLEGGIRGWAHRLPRSRIGHGRGARGEGRRTASGLDGRRRLRRPVERRGDRRIRRFPARHRQGLRR